MSGHPFNTDLDKNDANYVPLSPLSFLIFQEGGKTDRHRLRSTATLAVASPLIPPFPSFRALRSLSKPYEAFPPAAAP